MSTVISYLGIFLCLVSSGVAEEAQGQETSLAPLLIQLADGESFTARAVAARRLGRHEDPRAVNALLDALSDEHVIVREAAVGSLHRLTGQFLGFVPSDPPEKRSKAIIRWRDWWSSAEESFPGPYDRKAYVGYEDDINRLVRRIETEPNKHGGDSFIEVFGRIGGDAVVPLSRTLTSDVYYARWWGARALGKTGDRSAVSHLIRKLESHPEYMDIIALGWLRDRQAVKPITLLLQDHDDELRFWACKILGEFHDPVAVEPLRQVWKNDASEEIRSQALVALARCGDRDSLYDMVSRLANGWTGSKVEVIAVLRDLNTEMGHIIGPDVYKFSVVWIPPDELEKKAEFLQAWWRENKDNLVWDSTTGHFRVRADAAD
jgi:HEAT repeat protein